MIEVNNLTSVFIDEDDVVHAVDIVLKEEGREGGFSVAFVEEEEISSLNKSYRGKNEPTDVLSFSYPGGDILGEVIVCPAKVVEGNFYRILVHGVLHALGYNHGEEMESREKHLLENKLFKR